MAIDGSKFKAVNNRDRNFTDAKIKRRMEQIEESIARYLAAMDTADRAQSEVAEAKTVRLTEKIEKLKQQMEGLKEMEQRLQQTPDEQVSLTDPDARSMATSGRARASSATTCRRQSTTSTISSLRTRSPTSATTEPSLATMAEQARQATGIRDLTVVADRGYFKGEEILACEQAGIITYVPKPLTSNSKADGRFGKQDFVYVQRRTNTAVPQGRRLI